MKTEQKKKKKKQKSSDFLQDININLSLRAFDPLSLSTIFTRPQQVQPCLNKHTINHHILSTSGIIFRNYTKKKLRLFSHGRLNERVCAKKGKKIKSKKKKPSNMAEKEAKQKTK